MDKVVVCLDHQPCATNLNDASVNEEKEEGEEVKELASAPPFRSKRKRKSSHPACHQALLHYTNPYYASLWDGLCLWFGAMHSLTDQSTPDLARVNITTYHK